MHAARLGISCKREFVSSTWKWVWVDVPWIRCQARRWRASATGCQQKSVYRFTARPNPAFSGLDRFLGRIPFLIISEKRLQPAGAILGDQHVHRFRAPSA
jgi:hypothetical protein